MKNIIKLLISCVVFFIVGVWFGRHKSPIGGGFFILFLFLFLSFLISWIFDTLYIKEYKYIYNKLDKIIIFNKYPNNKEKNSFRLLGYFFIPFYVGMTIKAIFGGVGTLTLFEGFGGVFVMFIIYKFSLRFFF